MEFVILLNELGEHMLRGGRVSASSDGEGVEELFDSHSVRLQQQCDGFLQVNMFLHDEREI